MRRPRALDRDVIVSIFLRGGADGLTLVPPFGEAAYYTLRPTIAIPRPDSGVANAGDQPRRVLRSAAGDGGAGAGVSVAGSCSIVHATGSTDPTRSHFDAQFFMEIGKPGDKNVVTGWLGRHLASQAADASPTRRCARSAFAFGLPQTLAGAPDTLPIPDPGELRPGRQLVDPHAAARVARQRLPAERIR